MLLNVTWCVWNKCSAAHCDSVAIAFSDTNVASPHMPTSTDPSKHKTDDSVQPFLQTFPQRKHGKRFTAVQICIFCMTGLNTQCQRTLCTGSARNLVIKIVATSCQMSVFKAKMHQFRFRLGLAPDPTRGAYSAPPNPLAGFRGPTSKGEGKGKRRRRGERGEDMGGEVWTPPPSFAEMTPLLTSEFS